MFVGLRLVCLLIPWTLSICSYSLISFKLLTSISLLGFSCQIIDDYRRLVDEKVNKLIGGLSTSLPVSRHNSVADLTILSDEDKFNEIRDKFPLLNTTKPPSITTTKIGPSSLETKSVPQSPLANSPRDSLEDINERLELLRTSYDSCLLMSDSTVDLVSMNDGQHLTEIFDDKPSNDQSKTKPNSVRKRLKSIKDMISIKRRVSMHDLPKIIPFTDHTNKSIDDGEPPTPPPCTPPPISTSLTNCTKDKLSD